MQAKQACAHHAQYVLCQQKGKQRDQEPQQMRAAAAQHGEIGGQSYGGKEQQEQRGLWRRSKTRRGPPALSTSSAATANSSPPTIGAGILNRARTGTRSARTPPSTSTRQPASSDGRAERLMTSGMKARMPAATARATALFTRLKPYPSRALSGARRAAHYRSIAPQRPLMAIDDDRQGRRPPGSSRAAPLLLR